MKSLSGIVKVVTVLILKNLESVVTLIVGLYIVDATCIIHRTV